MGKRQSKQKLEAIIGSTYTCPSCQQIFDSKTPAKEVNEHIIVCSHSSSSSSSLSSKDLHTPLSLNIKPSKNKSISTKSMAKLNPFKIKNFITTKKISWIEGYDTITISRENCLEESIKEIEKINKFMERNKNFF